MLLAKGVCRIQSRGNVSTKHQKEWFTQFTPPRPVISKNLMLLPSNSSRLFKTIGDSMPEPCPPPPRHRSKSCPQRATASAAREARAFELGRDPRGAGEAPGEPGWSGWTATVKSLGGSWSEK